MSAPSRLRGGVLLALLRSPDAEERAVGLQVFREALERTGTIGGAARLLLLSRRSAFRVVAAHPELREGLTFTAGRPRKATGPRARQ